MQTKSQFFVGFLSGTGFTFLLSMMMGFDHKKSETQLISANQSSNIHFKLDEDDIKKISANMVNPIVERVLFCIDGSKINLEDEDGNEIYGKLTTYCNN